MTAFRVTGLYVASLDGKVCNRRVTEDCKSRCQGTGPLVRGKIGWMIFIRSLEALAACNISVDKFHNSHTLWIFNKIHGQGIILGSV